MHDKLPNHNEKLNNTGIGIVSRHNIGVNKESKVLIKVHTKKGIENAKSQTTVYTKLCVYD